MPENEQTTYSIKSLLYKRIYMIKMDTDFVLRFYGRLINKMIIDVTLDVMKNITTRHLLTIPSPTY